MECSPSNTRRKRSWLARLWSAIVPTRGERRRNFPLREAIDLVVTGTEPRIRGVYNYGRKLAPAVEQLLTHFNACGEWLLPPIEVSSRAWSSVPLVRTLFSSGKVMHDLFGQNKELRAFFSDHPEADHAFLAISALRQERKTLGMALSGDVLQRDIPQTVLGFSDLRIFGISDSETALRANTAQRGFGFMVGEALDKIVEEHLRRHGAEDEERILSLQLKALEHKKHLADALFDATVALDEKIRQLRERVMRQAHAVTHSPPTLATLEDYINQISSVLGHPERYITQQRFTLHVDQMNIEHEAAGEDAVPIVLSEVTIGERAPRVIILARYPRAELPAAKDHLAEAEHLLGM